MRGTRLLSAASLLSVMVSCDLPSPPDFPTTPPPPPVRQPATTVILGAQGTEFFVGEKAYLYVSAHDSAGRPTHSDMATVSSSDPTVITLGERFASTTYATDGGQVRGLRQAITMLSPGTATLRASIDGISDSKVLHVIPLPPVSTALVIDSFTVIEYRETCAWNCPYLVYAPLLKLREPTGTSPVYLHAVRFDVSSKSTGLCTAGQLKLGAGFVGHINHIGGYLWFNSLILVQLNGAPLADGPAKARVIFRDAQGVMGMAEAQAVIQRMVHNPQFPTTPFGEIEWSCEGAT